MNEFLSNTIAELDTCFLVDKDKRPYHYELLESNGTVELARSLLHGLPLGYYDQYDIVKLNSDELEQFHSSIDFIETIWYDHSEFSKYLNFTVDEGVEEFKKAKSAHELYVQQFYDRLISLLNEFVHVYDTDKHLESVLTDTVIANGYICFNATSATTLVLKNIVYQDYSFTYDINIYRSQESNSQFNPTASTEEFALWNLSFYLKQQLDVNRSDIYNLFVDYAKHCNSYTKLTILLANYCIPFIKQEMSIRGWTAYWSDTDRHNFYVVYRPNSNRVVETLTNKKTGVKLTKTHKLAQMTSNPDLVWKAAKTIFDFGFV